MHSDILNTILAKRGIDEFSREDFLSPDYDNQNDPFLLPDMKKAVDRLLLAHKNNEHITIYGDYDVDGVTSSALLLDAFSKFGFKKIDYFLPDRFIDGYGMSERAVRIMKDRGTDLIITVDCGSLNHQEIDLANELGIDVVVTDHHNIAEIQPNAIAVVNPRRKENDYPNATIFAGVGVAFKLVQALSYKLEGLEPGQEKWFLDLVALGTVCDIVPMVGENRQNVFWGLKVLERTRRPGIKSMLALAEVDNISTTTLGFVFGPRINAAGRLKNAEIALNLVMEDDSFSALEKAIALDELNSKRKKIQDSVFDQAKEIVNEYKQDDVLVVAGESFNEGIVGIVAAKLMDQYKKPTFVLSIDGNIAKGSARSFGDFSASQAIDFAKSAIIKGGGHDAAAGVTLSTDNIDDFRKKVNKFYKSLGLKNQLEALLPEPDIELDNLKDINIDLFEDIKKLEPFGPKNEEPIFLVKNLEVVDKQEMGAKKQHVKYTLFDGSKEIKMIKFNVTDEFKADVHDFVHVHFTLSLNEWRGRRTVEGMILNLKANKL